MQTFDELLREAEIAHGHLCAGQILGVRLAMLGCQRLGIDDPKGTARKRLVTFIEIDRCATDAIGVVTGCRLGKRALKFRDWGKMAATFVDLASPITDLNSTLPAAVLTPSEQAVSGRSQSKGESNASASASVFASEIGPDFSPDIHNAPKMRASAHGTCSLFQRSQICPKLRISSPQIYFSRNS